MTPLQEHGLGIAMKVNAIKEGHRPKLPETDDEVRKRGGRPKDEARRQRLREIIAKLGPSTTREVAAELGIPCQNMGATLRSMLKDRELKVVKTPGGPNKWSLAE